MLPKPSSASKSNETLGVEFGVVVNSLHEGATGQGYEIDGSQTLSVIMTL